MFEVGIGFSKICHFEAVSLMLPVQPSKTFSADPIWFHNLNLDSPNLFRWLLEHRPDTKHEHSCEGPFKSKSFRSLHKSNFTETKLLQESTEPNPNLHRQDQTHQNSWDVKTVVWWRMPSFGDTPTLLCWRSAKWINSYQPTANRWPVRAS